MEAKFRISEQDYVDAMRLFGKLTPRWIAIYSAAALAFAALAYFGSPVLRGGAIGGLIGGALVVLVLRPVLSPLLARRHYRKYKAMHVEFRVELVDDGVRIASPTAEGRITWEQVHKWRENDAFVLIYPMPRLFHIIPKALAAQGFDLQGLADGLRRHVGEPS
jgi:hypothetical protein